MVAVMRQSCEILDTMKQFKVQMTADLTAIEEEELDRKTNHHDRGEDGSQREFCSRS